MADTGALPEGFVLDPAASLPPGFQVDPAHALPPGFQVDQPGSVPEATSAAPQSAAPVGDLASQVAQYKQQTGVIPYVEQRLKSGWLNLESGLAGAQAATEAKHVGETTPLFDMIDRGATLDDLWNDPSMRNVVANNLDALQNYVSKSPDQRQAIRQKNAAEQQAVTSLAATSGAESAAIPRNPAIGAFSQAVNQGHYADAFKILATYPSGIIGGGLLESAPALAPALVAGYVNPVLGVGIMAGTDTASQYGSSVLNYLGQNGVDTSDPAAVKAALDDPKVRALAVDYAERRAAVIGAADVATGALAGRALIPARAIANVPLREFANVAVAQPLAQAAVGAAGEAGAQLASTGQIQNPGDIAMAGVGNLATAPAEAVAFGLAHRGETGPSGIKITRPPVPPEEPLALAGPGVPPTEPGGPAPTGALPSPTGGGPTPGASGLPAIGDVVGLRSASGAPQRIVVEGIQDGYVFGRDEAGRQVAATVPEFQRDLTTAPPPSTPVNATTIGEPDASFADVPPAEAGDINDFNPDREIARAPIPAPAPPPQISLGLPETDTAQRLTRSAAAMERSIAQAESAAASGAPGAKSPGEIQAMRLMQHQMLSDAADLLNRVGASNVGAPGGIAAPTPLGALSVAAAGRPTEATTGISLTQPGSPARAGTAGPAVTPAPLLSAAPAQSEASGGTLPALDTTAARLAPLSRAIAASVGEPVPAPAPAPAAAPSAPPSAPASSAGAPTLFAPLAAPRAPSFQELLANRTAILNNPAKLARQLGITPEEVAPLLQSAVRTGQIRQIQGGVTRNPKTGEVTQSRMAGRYAYGTGKPTLSLGLLDQIQAAGGVNDSGGELRAMDAQRWHVGKPGRRNLIQPNGMSYQELADWMTEEGYLLRPLADERNATNYHADPNDALAMIRGALSGQRVLPIGEAQPEPEPEVTPEHIRMAEVADDLRRLGEEPSGHTLEDLEAQLGERLALMGAATHEQAIAIFEAEDANILAALSPDARSAVMEAARDGDWESEPIPSGYGEGEPPAAVAPSSGGIAGAEPAGGPATGAGNRNAAEAERSAGEGAPQAIAPAGGAAEFTTERTAQGQQSVIPGAERSAHQLQAAQPERLRAGVEQKPADEGLFGDAHNQTDLLDRFWKDDEGALRIGRALRTTRTPSQDAVAQEAARLTRDTKPDTLRSLNPINAFMTMPVALAARDAPSARYFNALLQQHRRAEYLENDAVPQVLPYLRLDDAEKDRVNKVLEYARLYGDDIVDHGRRVVVRIPERPAPFGAKHPALSHPGDIVALSDKGTQAFFALKQFFADRNQQIGESIARETGYEGPFNEQAIRNAMGSNDASPREVKAATRALAIWQETVGNARVGYVPFARYGQKYIKILPRVEAQPGRDAEPPRLEDGHFEFVPVSAFDRTVSGRRGPSAVRERITELRRQFPQDRYTLTSDDVSTLSQNNDDINVPALERIISRMDRGSDSAEAIDAVLKEIAEQRKAGFRRQSRNIPGYSTDFERAIVDYLRHSSSLVARLEHRADVDGAYSATQQHRAQGVRQFWKDHKAYMERNGTDFGPLRKVAFFHYIWGNLASAATNAFQTPMVTLPNLALWAGPRALPLLTRASAEMAKAIRVGAHGVYLDPAALGNTPAERAMIDRITKEGVANPVISKEFQGSSQSPSKRLRTHWKRMRAVWDIGSSAFNVVEQANRYIAALTAFRAAQDPQSLRNLMQSHANDQQFRDAMRGGNATPENVARWFTDETQFIGGKINRPPMQRGLGGLLLQFRTYPFNILRILWKNLTRLGSRGKTAFAIMGAMMMGMSGLYGLPFVDEADRAATFINQQFNLIDPMIEMRIRQFVNDEAMSRLGADAQTSKWLAEAVTRGATRPVGVDMGQRVGLNGIIPDGTLWTSVPLLGSVMQPALQGYTDYRHGQPFTAAADVAGGFFGYPAQTAASALAWTQEGKLTARGDLVMPPSQISPGDVAAKALGFNPTDVARTTESRYQQQRLAASTQARASDMLRDAATHYAQAQDALAAGDAARAQANMQAFQAILAANAERLADPDIPEWQQIPMPTRNALRSAIAKQMNFDAAELKRSGKTKRGTMEEVQQLFGNTVP